MKQLNSRQKRMIRAMWWEDLRQPLFIMAVILGLLIAGFIVGTLQLKGI